MNTWKPIGEAARAVMSEYMKKHNLADDIANRMYRDLRSTITHNNLPEDIADMVVARMRAMVIKKQNKEKK